MTDIMLNEFIKDHHSDKAEGFADVMVKLVRNNFANIVFRGKPGYKFAGRAWYFDPKDEGQIKAFVMDQKNILKATEELYLGKGWGAKQKAIAGQNSQKSAPANGLISFGSPGGNITVSVKEIPVFFNSLTMEIQGLTDQNETLTKEVETLKQALERAAEKTPDDVSRSAISKTHGHNIAVFRSRRAIARGFQTQSAPVPSGGQPIRQKTREDVVRELVEIMVKNPDVLVGNQTKQQAKRKLCKIANEAGLRTVNGLPWSPWNISNYQKDVMELFKKVEKPRVRLTKDGAIVVPHQHQFAIAAE